MENDPVNKSNEEEYQFVDAEHSAEFAPPRKAGPAMPIKDANNEGRKKIFIFIGVLAALFCLYKLYDVFSAKQPMKAKNEVVVAPKPVPAVPAAPVEAPKPAEPVVTPEAAEMSKMGDKIGTLENVVSQVSQSNANLQDQMAGMATSILDLHNSLSTLSDQVAELAKPKPVPVEVKKPEKKKAPKQSAKKSAVKTSYYVKAMIQGRAWLMMPDGATLTVSEQDELPGYGQITSIDPEKGEIKTASGDVITYRSDDK